MENEPLVPNGTEPEDVPADSEVREALFLAARRAVDSSERRAARKAARKTPKHPIAYLIKVDFVWQLLSLLAIMLLTVLIYLAASGDTTREPFATLLRLSAAAVGLVSAVCLSAFFRKKTCFGGAVSDFKWMYLFIPDAATGWIAVPFAALAAGAETLSVRNGLYLFFGLVSVIASFLYFAYFVRAAAETDVDERRKRLKPLLMLSLLGYLLNLILDAVFRGVAGISVFGWIETAATLVIFLAVLFGAAFGIYKLPKLKPLWLSVLPILYYLLPNIFFIVRKAIA